MSTWILRTYPDNSNIPFQTYLERRILAIGMPKTSDRNWAYGMDRARLWINAKKPRQNDAWRMRCFEYLLCPDSGIKPGDLVVAVVARKEPRTDVRYDAIGLGVLGEGLRYEYDADCPLLSGNKLPHTLGPVDWIALSRVEHNLDVGDPHWDLSLALGPLSVQAKDLWYRLKAASPA